MAKQIAATVHVLKVALKGARRIWRRIAVRSDQTLDDLHAAIFDAFDRYDEHLYSFYFPPPGSRGRTALRQAAEYTHPENAEQGNPFSRRRVYNAARTPLRNLGLVPSQRFLYLFDFGDEWWHEVTVERTDAPVEQETLPCVLERHGESPPQYPGDDEDEDE